MRRFVYLIIFSVILLIPWSRLESLLNHNVIAKRVIQIELSKYYSNKFQIVSGTNICRSQWFQGILAYNQGDQIDRNIHLRAAIRCHPMYIDFLHSLSPNLSTDLAEYAIQTHPENATGWFWLAELKLSSFKGDNTVNLTKKERKAVIDVYKEGLKRDPTDGLRWRELGDLLRIDDPQAAISAYLESCSHGDPGSNGCWLAGQTAEQLGDFEKAIQYYRYSRWEDAQARADELEASLSLEK